MKLQRKLELTVTVGLSARHSYYTNALWCARHQTTTIHNPLYMYNTFNCHISSKSSPIWHHAHLNVIIYIQPVTVYITLIRTGVKLIYHRYTTKQNFYHVYVTNQYNQFIVRLHCTVIIQLYKRKLFIK